MYYRVLLGTSYFNLHKGTGGIDPRLRQPYDQGTRELSLMQVNYQLHLPNSHPSTLACSMMAGTNEPEYFSKMREKGHVVVNGA